MSGKSAEKIVSKDIKEKKDVKEKIRVKKKKDSESVVKELTKQIKKPKINNIEVQEIDL